MLALPPVTFADLQNNLPATPEAVFLGTQVAAHATIHTKGASWTELVATTTYDAYAIEVVWAGSFTSATVTDMLLDIGIGASSSETPIISNLQVGWTRVNSMVFPLFIPKGSRLSARAQALISADVIGVSVFLYGGPSGLPWPTFTICDAYGADTAASDGTAITPGASGTESSWGNVGSTLSRNYGAVFPIISSNADTSLTAQSIHVEVGIASTKIAEFLFQTEQDERIMGPYPTWPFQCSLPSGTQLMARAESSGTAEAMEIVLYCLG
jgi:hypothetical protein